MDNAYKEIIIKKQRSFFESGKTLPVGYRIMALKKLGRAIRNYESRIIDALHEDLGKSEMEAFMCEVGISLSEISYMLCHIQTYAAPRIVPTPITNFPSISTVYKCPYGNVLIMSPWNYPFLLAIEPLIDALAAGNTAIIKPSAYSPATSAILEEMISETFPEEYVAVINGGREENAFLLTQKFDYIFFTGSKNVGREVMRRASE
jgi:aldehyde dehydrogenase (NAD+)